MTRPPHAASSVVGYASHTASAVAKVEPNSNRSRETGRPYVDMLRFSRQWIIQQSYTTAHWQFNGDCMAIIWLYVPHYFLLQYHPQKYIMLCTFGIGHSSLLYSSNHPWPPVRMRYGVCLRVWNLTRVGSLFCYDISYTVLLCITIYWEFINISLVRTFNN